MDVCLANELILIQQLSQERKKIHSSRSHHCHAMNHSRDHSAFLHIFVSTSVFLLFLVNSSNAEDSGTFHCHKECLFLDFRVHSVVTVQSSNKIVALGVWARYYPWLALGKGSMLYQRVIRLTAESNLDVFVTSQPESAPVCPGILKRLVVFCVSAGNRRKCWHVLIWFKPVRQDKHPICILSLTVG